MQDEHGVAEGLGLWRLAVSGVPVHPGPEYGDAYTVCVDPDACPVCQDEESGDDSDWLPGLFSEPWELCAACGQMLRPQEMHTSSALS